MKTLWLAALVIIAPVMLSGCSTTANFSHTPTDSAEFSKSLSDLKQNYSDIEEYDRLFASATAAPATRELENIWGKPTTTKRWGLFVFNLGLDIALVSAGYITYPIAASLFLMAPVPAEEYVWKKGHYEIVVQGRNDAFVRYENRIHRWEWKEQTDTGSVALKN